MEKKEQGIAPQIQQTESVSYQEEVKDSHIDMNPLHGPEAEHDKAVAKQAMQESMIVEPGVGQVVEPLTKSAVIVEEKPVNAVPENGFPVGYGPNEHMKKIEKPKAPSFRERMKHARRKMSKKQKILAITIPSVSVVLIGGFIIFASITGMFKTDYSGTYLAARELRNEMQKLRTDTNCDRVIEYVSMQYTAMETYSNYIEGCKTASAGVSDAVVQKVGDTNGVGKDEEVRRRYETLKTALETAKEGNSEVNGLLEIYKTWHEWVLAEADGNNKHQEWDWTDADLKKASEILTNSDIEEFKKYGEEWYKLKKEAAEATNAYFHHALDTASDLPTLKRRCLKNKTHSQSGRKQTNRKLLSFIRLSSSIRQSFMRKFEEVL